VPLGFYNEVQDLDQVRTFASLPLNFYPRSLRAINAYYDGVTLYGNLSTAGAGSFDYQVYAGFGQEVDEDMPFMRGLGAVGLKADTVGGLALTWNTPVDGLRVGYSFQMLPDLAIDLGFPKTEVDYRAHVLSAEYTRGKWVFTSEYKHLTAESEVTNLPVPKTKQDEDQIYGQVTYQLNDKLGLGAYYAHSNYDTGTDHDTAFVAAYAIQPWWLVKAEVHFLDGINNLDDAGDLNPGANDDTWTYFVLKTTVSF
jgi:hypothetical protein